MEQTMKDLEKTLDLEFCGQVSFKNPQPTGESSSTPTIAQQVAQERTTPATGTAKGKELVVVEQEIMEEQPTTSKEHSQGQAPSLQTQAPEVPTLQTPLPEERSKKRDREETTPTSGSTGQQEAKRQRVDPPEEDTVEDITGSPRGGRAISQQTSTSSHRQEGGRHHGMEVSSSRSQAKKPSDIKQSFKEMKAQNESLRIQLYDQFLKMTPSK